MKRLSRRETLRGFLVAGAAATTVSALPGVAAAGGKPSAPSEAQGMLYDATLCIGCKACMSACAEANDLPPDRGDIDGGIHQAPRRLNEHTKNIIQLYEEPGTGVRSFVKRQCMHCVDPACVSACMMHALTKDATTGIVSWSGDRCVGCRYCQIGCPFGVPAFEWTALNPRIIKCELCRHRKQGPACCEVCPRGAVIWGKRADLLAEAKRRLARSPGLYIDHVYGESEGGGTQVLYLSAVPFEKLGLPTLGEESLPEGVHKVQGALYRGFVAPLALFGCLGLAIQRRMKARSDDDDDETDESHTEDRS